MTACLRAATAACVVAAAVLSSGCLVVSLQPIYDGTSVVFDEALVGEWENPEDGARATIERGEWRSYRIVYADRSSTRTFQANLTRIGTDSFLDLTELRGVDPGPYLVPVHGVVRIAVSGDTLTAALLDYDWFMRAGSAKSIGRLTVAVDDRRNVVLTGATAELRRWLGERRPAAFAEPATFTKKRP